MGAGVGECDYGTIIIVWWEAKGRTVNAVCGSCAFVKGRR